MQKKQFKITENGFIKLTQDGWQSHSTYFHNKQDINELTKQGFVQVIIGNSSQ
jgi:ribosomal protein L35